MTIFLVWAFLRVGGGVGAFNPPAGKPQPPSGLSQFLGPGTDADVGEPWYFLGGSFAKSMVSRLRWPQCA